MPCDSCVLPECLAVVEPAPFHKRIGCVLTSSDKVFSDSALTFFDFSFLSARRLSAGTFSSWLIALLWLRHLSPSCVSHLPCDSPEIEHHVSPSIGLMWWFCASLWLTPIPCAMYAPCGSRRSNTSVPGRPSFWLAASWICATLTWMQSTEHGDP